MVKDFKEPVNKNKNRGSYDELAISRTLGPPS